MSSEVVRFDARVPRFRRAAALGTVVAMHAAVFILVMSLPPSRPRPREPKSFTLISVAEMQRAAARPIRALPNKLPAPVQLATVALATNVASEAASPSSGDSCPTLDTVSKAILADPTAVAAVAEAPADTRSIADAIVIWNAGWTPATDPIAEAAPPPLAPVRSAVLASLAGIESRCLDEPVAGPRFIPVAVGEQTRLLVFGSGNWTWRDLNSDRLAPATPPDNPAAGFTVQR